MEDLTYPAKVAVLKILNEIVNADKIVREKEVAYMEEVARSFELADNYNEELNNIVTLQALCVVRELAPATKAKIAQLMGKMIVIDEDINYNEVKLYNMICELCNIENDFNIEDYPDYSLSGPFDNPEDMMNTVYENMI